MPAYQANFRRMGFSDEEISDQADRFVDALVPWGDPDKKPVSPVFFPLLGHEPLP